MLRLRGADPGAAARGESGDGTEEVEKSWELTGIKSRGGKLLEGIEWRVVPVQAHDAQGFEGEYAA